MSPSESSSAPLLKSVVALHYKHFGSAPKLPSSKAALPKLLFLVHLNMEVCWGPEKKRDPRRATKPSVSNLYSPSSHGPRMPNTMVVAIDVSMRSLCTCPIPLKIFGLWTDRVVPAVEWECYGIQLMRP